MTKQEMEDAILDVLQALNFLREQSRSTAIHEVVLRCSSDRLLELSSAVKGLKRFS